MKITFVLADAAQAINGKLYLLGGGWSSIVPGTPPFAIGIIIAVPWDQTNRKHKLRLVLLTTDKQPVTTRTQIGADQPVQIEAEFEVGRPPGVKAGSPQNVVLALNMAQIPLPPDTRLEWVASINDKSQDDWRWSFTTLPLQQNQP